MPKIYIIGAGGVASYLIPILFNTFRDQIDHVVIFDKDIVEERNLLRQVFPEDSVGATKARALRAAYSHMIGIEKITAFGEWFYSGFPLKGHLSPKPEDWFISVADNHRARRDVCAAVREYNCRGIIAGNEYISAQAMVMHPLIHDLSPDVRYDLSSDEGSPFHCNTEEALSAFPQLALANATCATFICSLLYAWINSDTSDTELLDVLPVEFNSSKYGYSRRTVANLRG